jgi:serine/threonine-protein kinase
MRSLVIALLFVLLSTQLASAGRRHARPVTPVATQPAPLTAGAIAYSPSTGRVGWAYGYADQESARLVAEEACGYEDCRWQVSEHGAVAVLVLGNGGAHYNAWDHDLATAQQRALEQCSANATGCYVARSVTN